MSWLERLKILGSKKIKITNWRISQKIIFVTVAAVIIGGVAGTIFQLEKLKKLPKPSD